MQALFLAKGWRHDVEPMAFLASAFQKQYQDLQVDFVTYRVHKGWLTELFADTKVRPIWLKAKPQEAFPTVNDEEYSTCYKCLLTSQMKPTSEAENASRALIICNLAAIHAVHLAEAICLPCIVVCPGSVPYSFPEHFSSQLQARLPALHKALKESSQGKVGWEETEYWMWPLYDPKWQQWRQGSLGLPPTLYQSAVQAPQTPPKVLPGNDAQQRDDAGVVLPDCVPLLLGIGKPVLEQTGKLPCSVQACGFWQATGKPAEETAIGAQSELDSLLAVYPGLKGKTFAEWQGGKRLVCIHLGSAASMSLLPDTASLFKLLNSALEAADAKGVLLTEGHKPLFFDMWMAAIAEADPTLITDVSHFPPLSQLLPRCSAIMHHGNSNITAAALASATPQIICPFTCDQLALASSLCCLGVALQGPEMLMGTIDIKAMLQTPGTSNWSHSGTQSLPSGAEASLNADSTEGKAVSNAQQLSQKLQEVMSGSMHQACQQAKTTMLAEQNGVSVAVDFIYQHMKKNAACAQLGNVRLPAHGGMGDATDDDIYQEYVKLPNGWEVSAQAEMEGLFIHNEIFRNECYGRHGINIRDGDTVVDVGANVGMFVCWALKGDKGKGRGVPGRILALEPVPQNLLVMEHNLKHHDMTSQVQVIPKAVGATLGELQIRFYPNMPGNSTCHVQEKMDLQGEMMQESLFADAQDSVCPVTTISQLIKDNDLSHIDLLKIDVEGCELEVLQGVLPQDWACIKQVALELHDVGTRLQVATDLLQANGFAVHTERDFPPQNVMMYALRH